MELAELLAELGRGEDSSRQFKADFTSPDSLAAELVAFSNGGGGRIFIGVDDSGLVRGLGAGDVRRLNQMISGAASQSVHPAVYPVVENIATPDGLVMAVTVPPGPARPYQDRAGAFWMKSGADKRRVTAREELRRMFQDAGMLHADETPVPGATAADVDADYFARFFARRYETRPPDSPGAVEQAVRNLKLGGKGGLNLSGVLLFARDPAAFLPEFIVRAGAFDGTDLAADRYADSRDIGGKLADVFQQAVGFIMGNLRHVQGRRTVNSIGGPEIPRVVFEELVANALIHRDYFISAPVRIFVFRDRVEIISPGHLPNNLTVENIKAGNSNTRNAVLASFANHLIPYRGFGSGILRVLKNHPDTDFEDDRDGNLFKATVRRSAPAGDSLS